MAQILHRPCGMSIAVIQREAHAETEITGGIGAVSIEEVATHVEDEVLFLDHQASLELVTGFCPSLPSEIPPLSIAGSELSDQLEIAFDDEWSVHSRCHRIQVRGVRGQVAVGVIYLSDAVSEANVNAGRTKETDL